MFVVIRLFLQEQSELDHLDIHVCMPENGMDKMTRLHHHSNDSLSFYKANLLMLKSNQSKLLVVSFMPCS